VSCRESAVGRALDGAWAPVQDVCVDHGGADVLVAEEFLNCPDVVAVLQQVGGRGVAKRVAAHALGARGARYKCDGLGWRGPMSSCARLDYTPF
jgi:hypothetical protein